MKTKIYVVSHKKMVVSDDLKNAGYELISVGGGNNVNTDGKHDNQGINISEKNANYCELTALYWLWNNEIESDILGFCHYRRYFTKAVLSQNEKYFLTDRDAAEIVDRTDGVIVPWKSRYIRPAYYNYLKCGRKKDLDILRNIISTKNPEYLPDYDYIMNHNWSYLTNMMIARREIWEEYCEWLFGLLFEVEKRVDLRGYTAEEKRIYGYMSERLLTVWIRHNHIKVREFRTVNTEEHNTCGYKIREVAARLHIYQGLKTLIYLVRGRK